MKTTILISLMMMFFPFALNAADAPKTKPAPAKSQFNTQIYEDDSTTESFTAVVKVIREVQGETEVFFEGKQGFYQLGSASQQEKLVKSQKGSKPVHVTVESGSRKITAVEFKD